HLAHLKHGGVDVSGIDRPKPTRAATLGACVEQAHPGSDGELYVDYSTGNYCLSRSRYRWIRLLKALDFARDLSSDLLELWLQLVFAEGPTYRRPKAILPSCPPAVL